MRNSGLLRGNMLKDFLSVAEAADLIGLSEGRIRQLMRSKRLKGKKFGNAWVISIASLKSYRTFPQKTPKKNLEKS